MSRGNDSGGSAEYGYAVARIRAMEPRLLGAAVYQRMLDAEDLPAVVKVLGETSYAAALATHGGDLRYDAILEAELNGVYDEILSFVPDKSLVELCRITYDFHNVKVILKSLFNTRSDAGRKRWDLLTNLGSVKPDELVERIEAEDYHLLPFRLGRILPDCLSLWEQTKDVVEVERILDDALYAAMLADASALMMPGVLKWVRARIDAENLRNLLRLQRFGMESSKAAAFLHAGGELDTAHLLGLLAESFENWSRQLVHSGYGAALAQITETERFDDLMVMLEKALDDYATDLLGAYRFSSSAPENVLLYLWLKEMEVKNVRIILVSKGDAASREQARRLLRHGFA